MNFLDFLEEFVNCDCDLAEFICERLATLVGLLLSLFAL